MLDKNPKTLANNLIEKFSDNIDIIITSTPFHKAKLLELFLNSTNHPIIFLDFDLLFSGYVVSDMIQVKDNIHIFRPNSKNWKYILRDILEKISQERFLVVIDSFNGFYNMCSDVRFANAILMLLLSMGKFKRCPILVMALAKKKENKWMLLPGGRSIMSHRSNFYIIKNSKNTLVLEAIKND